MGEVGPARRKSQRESTRRRFLAGGIDIGVRAHEIFRDYWGVQMEILAGGFEVTDSGNPIAHKWNLESGRFVAANGDHGDGGMSLPCGDRG